VSEAVDGCNDLGRVSRFGQVGELEIGVFDCVVQHRRDLVFRIRERDPLGMPVLAVYCRVQEANFGEFFAIPSYR
jgi:hypothetical protein